MKKYKHGAVLGKFMPLTLGHEYLINTAIKNSEKVTVMVCTLAKEPIDGELRYKWVRDRYAKEIEQGVADVVHLKENWMPQEPSDCFSDIVFYGTWAGVITAFCGEKPDAFFSSEMYGYPVAKALGCVHELVDLERKRFPVSGTKCRENPKATLDFMNPNVRAYFECKKILILGTESTGKSTLTMRLANYYNMLGYEAADIQEFAREWIDNNLNGDMNRLTQERIPFFAEKQWGLVDDAFKSGKYNIIFSDTDALVSKVFYLEYYAGCHYKIEGTIQQEEWDLVLFTQPDVPWVDDGQRNLPDSRDDLTEEFRLLLDIYKWPYVVVKGDWDERFEIATQAIDELLKVDVQKSNIMV